MLELFNFLPHYLAKVILLATNLYFLFYLPTRIYLLYLLFGLTPLHYYCHRADFSVGGHLLYLSALLLLSLLLPKLSRQKPPPPPADD